MLGFILRLVSGLCIGVPLGCLAYLSISIFAREFHLSGLLICAGAAGLAAFASPEILISGLLKSLLWNKI